MEIPRRTYDSGMAALLLAPMFWGGNFVVGRMIGGDVPPAWLNLFRWVLAAVVLAPFFLPGVMRIRKYVVRELPALAVLSALGLVGFNNFLYLGLASANLASAALTFALTPFLVIFIDACVGSRRLNLRTVSLSLMCFFGVVLSQWSDLSGDQVSSLGMIYLAAAAVSFAAYSVALRYLAQSIPSSEGFFAQVLLCVPIQFWIALQVAPDFSVWELEEREWISIAYLGVFASAFAFSLWSRGLRRINSEQAGGFLALVPVFAGFFGWAFLNGETSGTELGLLVLVACAAFGLSRVPK